MDYKTKFVKSSKGLLVFYQFYLGKKKVGALPADISYTHRGKTYTTAQALGLIGGSLRQGKVKEALLGLNEIKSWGGMSSREHKEKFIQLVRKLEKLVR
jgi:hypothetical protein